MCSCSAFYTHQAFFCSFWEKDTSQIAKFCVWEICQFGKKFNCFKSNFGIFHNLKRGILIKPMEQLWKATLQEKMIRHLFSIPLNLIFVFQDSVYCYATFMVLAPVTSIIFHLHLQADARFIAVIDDSSCALYMKSAIKSEC